MNANILLEAPSFRVGSPSFTQNKLPEYGEIERLILSMGTVRIMEPGEKIPVPLQAGKIR